MTIDWVWMFFVATGFFYAVELSEQSQRDLPERPKPAIVIGLATVLAWPFLDQNGVPDWAFSLKVAVSFGLFVSSLLPFTFVEPQPTDVHRPLVFLIKWARGWAGQAIILLVAAGALHLLSLIPFLHRVLGKLGGIVPAIGGTSRPFLRSLLDEALPITVFLGITLKMRRISQRSIIAAFSFAICISYIGVSFLRLVDVATAANRQLTIAGVLGGAVLVDLLVSAIKAQVGSGRGFEPPF